MTQKIRENLSVVAVLASFACALVLLVAARAAAEHASTPRLAKNAEIHAAPR
jgi:hypothetical protein